MVKEIYGTDTDLVWDSKTKTASIYGYHFGSIYGNGTINSQGKMIVESSYFMNKVAKSNPPRGLDYHPTRDGILGGIIIGTAISAPGLVSAVGPLALKLITPTTIAIANKAGEIWDKGKNVVQGLVPKATNVTSIYRAVGADEYYSIMNSQKFASSPLGMDAKQFGASFSETIQFANRYKDIVAIFEVKIPSNALSSVSDFTIVDKFIFRSGTYTIQPDLLSRFNDAIIKITHIY
jgi:hypothetical protein